MNSGFKDLAAGAYECGLAKLDADPDWHDDRSDLDGPFRLGFPGAKGWGEELLVASLLKRRSHASKAPIQICASDQVCSILNCDPAFRPNCHDDNRGRSPLAILQHALVGDLLDEPFVPLASLQGTIPSNIGRRPRVGIAWASVSSGHPILEKSVPVKQFLDAISGIDADLISLQRELHFADPCGLAVQRGVQLIDSDILAPVNADPNLTHLVGGTPK